MQVNGEAEQTALVLRVALLDGAGIAGPSTQIEIPLYRISVQNYEQCSAGDIAFTVTVAHDQIVETYQGRFLDGTASEAVAASNVVQVATLRLEP